VQHARAVVSGGSTGSGSISGSGSGSSTIGGAVVINSVLSGGDCGGRVAADTLIEHCRLTGAYRIDAGALASGLRSVSAPNLRSDMVMQEVQLSEER
jgi:hypothetical protein